MSDRESFLRVVRQAVAEGNRAGAIPPLPERGKVGYQGAGADPVSRLRDEVIAAGGQFHLVGDPVGAVSVVLGLVRARCAHRVLLGEGAFIDTLLLRSALAAVGVTGPDGSLLLCRSSTPGRRSSRPTWASPEPITWWRRAGTVVLATPAWSAARRARCRRFTSSWLTATRSCRTCSTFLSQGAEAGLPACSSLITGPSKTGDIELTLVDRRCMGQGKSMWSLVAEVIVAAGKEVFVAKLEGRCKMTQRRHFLTASSDETIMARTFPANCPTLSARIPSRGEPKSGSMTPSRNNSGSALAVEVDVHGIVRLSIRSRLAVPTSASRDGDGTRPCKRSVPAGQCLRQLQRRWTAAIRWNLATPSIPASCLHAE